MHRKDILEKARDLTSGERAATYGEPQVNMSASEELKQVWRKRRKKQVDEFLGTGKSLAEDHDRARAHDEAIEMALTKIGRIATGKPHLDNYIDAAAYLAIAGEQVTQPQGAEVSERKVPRRHAYSPELLLREIFEAPSDASVTFTGEALACLKDLAKKVLEPKRPE